MKIKSTVLALAVFALTSLSPATAATYSGMITATRDSSRSIVSAVLETANRDGAGNPVSFDLVMDENGKAIAEQYENKDIKIDGTLNGKSLTADTWEGLSQPAPASREPEPSYEEEAAPADDSAEPSDDSAKDDEEVKDEEPQDDQPVDEEPKDEEPKDEEPSDEESSD